MGIAKDETIPALRQLRQQEVPVGGRSEYSVPGQWAGLGWAGRDGQSIAVPTGRRGTPSPPSLCSSVAKSAGSTGGVLPEGG